MQKINIGAFGTAKTDCTSRMAEPPELPKKTDTILFHSLALGTWAATLAPCLARAQGYLRPLHRLHSSSLSAQRRFRVSVRPIQGA